MKRTSLFISIFLAVLAASGCSSTAPAASPVPANTAVVMPSATGTLPAGTGGAEATAAERFETEEPLLTPWPEPNSVDYSGRWLDVARDSEPSRYPSLELADQFVDTTWGAIKLPAGWSIEEGDGPSPILVDGKGRKVGMIYQLNSYPDEPWFGLLPDGLAPILWETPDYPMDARVITAESETPSAAQGNRRTIVRQVSIIIDGPVFDDIDNAYYIAICLELDKAYVDGGKVEYVLSNKVIDGIARSLIESWQKD